MRIGNFVFLERKSLANPTPEEAAIFGAQIGLIDRAQAIAVPAVASAIRAVSEAAASLQVGVVSVAEDGSETPDRSHPVAELLRGDVNDWTSAFDFIRDLVAVALTDDKGSVAWVNRVDDKPVEIIRFQASAAAVSYDTATGEPTYRLNDRPVPAADVIHLRSPFDKSPLTLAMRSITVAWHLENHALNLFKKGARPGGIIEFPKGLGDDGLKKMKAGWRAAFAGSENTGETAVLWDGATFKAMTINSTDAQFLENRKFQIIEIARAFRVPPSMLFELDRATWSNGEQQQKEFLSYTLEPWLQALEAALGRALFNNEERGRYHIRFDRDDLTRASLTDRATAINSLIASETLNPNEGRSWLGLPPYAGGETYGNRNITTEKKPQAEKVA